MGKSVILTREELHALVWAEPLSQVGRRYGLPDYRLRKLCIRMSIPMPRADHWNKVRAGKGVDMIPLPLGYQGESSVTLRLVGSQHVEVRSSMLSNTVDPLVSAVKSTLLRNMKDRHFIRDGLVRRGDGQLDIRVAPPTIERACRFIHCFLQALRGRGHTLRIKEYATYIQVEQEELPLVCREKLQRVSLPNPRPWHSTELRPSGVLALQLADRFHGREWKEGSLSLEDQIPTILDKLEAVSRVITAEKQEWARHREEREKEERKQKEKERRREKELTDFKDLLSNAGRWRQAVVLREYLAAIEKKALSEDDVAPCLRDWLIWAGRMADWYDPLTDTAEELLADVDKQTLTFNPKQTPFNHFNWHGTPGEMDEET